nr:reverse transcriptase domain-containing protein [Tanacetum cinerariifolium]
LTLRHRDTINAAVGGTFMKRRPKECYDLIENMTAHHNNWDTSAQRSESSSSITSSSDQEIIALKAKMAEINKNLMKVKAVTPNCETCGGPHSYNDCPATIGQTQNVYAAGAYQGGNSYQPQGNRNLLSYRSDNYLGPPGFNQNQNQNNQNQKFQNQNKNHGIPQGNNQGRNQFFQVASHGPNPPLAYQAPAYQASVYQALMNTASSSGLGTLPSNTVTNPKEDLKGITTQSGTAYQGPAIPTTSSSLPQVVECETEIETSILNSEPVVAPVVEPVVAPISAPKPNQKPSIPYPSRFHDQNFRDKANDQKEKFFKIFQDLNFNISFADALILMRKFGPTIKTLLTNKDKLSELARTPLNEHCSVVLLKKLPQKLGALAIFSFHLSLPELTPTLMTLELTDRSISQPIGVTEDVYVKVGKFHFPADFVVVDFDADPRIPLILERSFLKTRRALIDVYAGELTLRVNNEAVTFNLDQTSRYSANYNDMTANRINVIDMDCEEYSDFLLEEVDAFLALEDNPTSPEVDHSYYDPEMDILLLEAFLNDDPSLPPPNQGMYLPQHQKRVNPKIHDVIKKEVLKLLDAGLIYPISDSPWVSPVHCVPKKGCFTVVENEENELILTRLVTGWRVCIDYHKLNEATRKDHFPLPFMDQMVERLAGNEYYCFLDGFSGYFQIPINLKDQENTTFTCPYGTFAYRRMPFGLCNAPGTFQRCMMAIFHDMIEKMMEVFMEDFSIFRNSFGTCLSHLEKMLKRCKDTNLCLNWEKSHFMVKEGIVLDHKISKNGIEGIDIMGPFPSSRGNKYILVAVDYLSKWVKAKELLTNDVRLVCKFLKSLFARFGTPLAIISDRGTHFYNDQFAKVMLKYGVTHRLATAYHP